MDIVIGWNIANKDQNTGEWLGFLRPGGGAVEDGLQFLQVRHEQDGLEEFIEALLGLGADEHALPGEAGPPSGAAGWFCRCRSRPPGLHLAGFHPQIQLAMDRC